MQILTKQSQKSRRNLLKYVSSVMEENEAFLCQNARDTYEEVIELVNDSIDCLRLINKENYSSRAMTFFFQHVFMPQSYAMYVDLLSGNLPMCFTELRLIAESLAKSYDADLRCPSDMFFKNKFELLERDLRKRNVSITKMIKEVEKTLKIKGGFSNLWKRLSDRWVHPSGLVNRVVEYISNRQDAPPWGLVLPMSYTKSDLPELKELEKTVIKFRKILLKLPNLYFLKIVSNRVG